MNSKHIFWFEKRTPEGWHIHSNYLQNFPSSNQLRRKSAGIGPDRMAFHHVFISCPFVVFLRGMFSYAFIFRLLPGCDGPWDKLERQAPRSLMSDDLSLYITARYKILGEDDSVRKWLTFYHQNPTGPG